MIKRTFKFCLRNLKRVADRLSGTVIDEFYWKFRSASWARACLSSSNIKHPHRRFLINKIGKYYPFENILEVGCASGPNLYLLSRRLPNIRIFGTDINKKAINIGQDWFVKKNITNVCLFNSKAEDLSMFSNKSIDIVFTDATLIYVGPDKIQKVLSEIFRIARKVVIFNEWHYDKKSVVFYNDHWVYNWRLLLKEFTSQNNLMFSKIPDEVWAGDWTKYGYVIEVNLS